MSTKLKEQWKDAHTRYRQTEKYKETRTAYWYKVRYNLSMETYKQMLENQNYVCAICGKPETSKNAVGDIKPLAVDHCHSTGKIRGLLCHKCNVLLGKASDDVSILENAIKYLKEHS